MGVAVVSPVGRGRGVNGDWKGGGNDGVASSPTRLEILYALHCMTRIMVTSPKDQAQLEFLREALSSISYKPWYAHGIAEAIMRTANLSVPLKALIPSIWAVGRGGLFQNYPSTDFAYMK
ncbi:hypothetical protein TEA_010049 [Camellia sinensis var. sinensis]|uniref:Uncharacterized protein n=1 Tax=Camellia sinensis var. sinensis TaxID=542762 RepID=A0A4S4DFU9_CAMSN|nr:hypothetical protein TEA_010049 [Camellia sinensis var. sinensis]